jgi:hypothetical protein
MRGAQYGEKIVCSLISAYGKLDQPFRCAIVIKLDAFTSNVRDRRGASAVEVSLFSGSQKLGERFPIIFGHSSALLVSRPQVILRICVSLVRSPSKQAHGLTTALESSQSLFIHFG